MEIVKLKDVTDIQCKILSNIHVVNISEFININSGIYINKRVTFDEDISIIKNAIDEYTDTDVDKDEYTDVDVDTGVDIEKNKDTYDVDETKEKMHNTINLRQLVYNFILKYLYKIRNLWTT